jgi:hypothetical protein
MSSVNATGINFGVLKEASGHAPAAFIPKKASQIPIGKQTG